jgi:glycosyltransferase involved in cell wall biosynthesis
MASRLKTRPLKVLQVVPALEAGGAELTALELASGLAQQGHRALVASAGGRLVAELAASGAEHVKLPLASRNPLSILANAGALARVIRAEEIDIVHARSRAPAWSAWLACRRTGTPLVTTYHGAYAERGPLKRLYNSVMARGDAVIAPSRFIARLVAERHGIPEEQVALVHDGVDLARFSPDAVAPERRAALAAAWGLAGGERVVLMLARLSPVKGQRHLIAAMADPALARRDDLVVVLAGGGQGRDAYAAELAGLANRLGCASRLRFVGHCADVPAALALADVAVLASVVPEALGRAAVEAQAVGIPTIVTALGAAPETVLAPPAVADARRTGWHVPPGDAAALASAIAQALDLAPDARAALAALARQHAAGFELTAMVAGTLAVYEAVLARRAGRLQPLTLRREPS